MGTYYLGIDVSKGYGDFVILEKTKQRIEDSFQLDDTFNGHCLLYERLVEFFDNHPDCLLYAGVESTGGYENNWYNSLVKFPGTLNIQTARLNPLGVNANSRADLKRNVIDQISAQNIAEFMIAHSEKVTVIGISDYSAIGLILEIQSVKRFASVKRLASFFGLHPVFKLSGDGSGGFHMSKKGRKEPRRILFMVTIAAIKHNPLISSIYAERLKKGMYRMAAIGYCMHKILRIIYGMLKTKTDFDPEIDRANRSKNIQRQKKTRKDKSRRYQDYDS